jgi:hypothetical protein
MSFLKIPNDTCIVSTSLDKYCAVEQIWITHLFKSANGNELGIGKAYTHTKKFCSKNALGDS